MSEVRYFVENRTSATYWEWLLSKGTNYTCYNLYMETLSEEQILDNKIDVIRTIIYAMACPVQFSFFYWSILVFILHKFNFNKPVMKIILYHFLFRCIGDILDKLGNLLPRYYATTIMKDENGNDIYGCQNYIYMNEMHPFKWFMTRQLGVMFWFTGEIIADWYPLLRTRAAARDSKSIWIVYTTCIIFNLSKVSMIIYHFTLRPTELYDEKGVYRSQRVVDFYFKYWVIHLIIIYASLIYDFSVFYVLKKCIFNKRSSEIGFIRKFRTMSEFRILISVIISIVFLPLISITILLKYYYAKANNYRNLNFSFDEIRQLIANVQYFMIFIDQIMLIVSKEDRQPISSSYDSSTPYPSGYYYSSNNRSNYSVKSNSSYQPSTFHFHNIANKNSVNSHFTNFASVNSCMDDDNAIPYLEKMNSVNDTINKYSDIVKVSSLNENLTKYSDLIKKNSSKNSSSRHSYNKKNNSIRDSSSKYSSKKNLSVRDNSSRFSELVKKNSNKYSDLVNINSVSSTTTKNKNDNGNDNFPDLIKMNSINKNNSYQSSQLKSNSISVNSNHNYSGLVKSNSFDIHTNNYSDLVKSNSFNINNNNYPNLIKSNSANISVSVNHNSLSDLVNLNSSPNAINKYPDLANLVKSNSTIVNTNNNTFSNLVKSNSVKTTTNKYPDLTDLVKSKSDNDINNKYTSLIKEDSSTGANANHKYPDLSDLLKSKKDHKESIIAKIDNINHTDNDNKMNVDSLDINIVKSNSHHSIKSITGNSYSSPVNNYDYSTVPNYNFTSDSHRNSSENEDIY